MNRSTPVPREGEGQIPIGQRLFDNVFLLLVVGIVVMFLVYTGWGAYELFTMPAGTLP
jgi:hypothetical protein